MQEFYIDSDGIQIHAKLEMPESTPAHCPLCIVQHGLTGHMEENHIVAVAAALREARETGRGASVVAYCSQTSSSGYDSTE